MRPSTQLPELAAGPTPGEPARRPFSPVPPEEPQFDPGEKGEEDADRRFLNEFSWLDFIALNWPAADNKRGSAHENKTFGDPAKRVVWESWKSLDELFPADPTKTPPTKWDSYEANLSLRWFDREKKQQHYSIKDQLPGNEPGKVKLLQELARLNEANQPQFIPGGKGGPLIARNRTYVRFETRVNQVAYEFMTRDDHKYYIRANLPATFEFDAKSIHVKAAWVELPEDEAVKKRFYHTRAKVLVDWTADGQAIIEERVVGLVGLHIVHKTPGRRDWIWSTFEHVDNLAYEHNPITRPGTFGKSDAKPAAGQSEEPPPLEPQKPFPKTEDRIPTEVVRVTKIHPTTEDVNQRFRQRPGIKGTVWENYQLVGTQWPRNGLRTRPPAGLAKDRLPQALANVTLETYPPANGSSCLNCHQIARQAEFVFYPHRRAYPVPQP